MRGKKQVWLIKVLTLLLVISTFLPTVSAETINTEKQSERDYQSHIERLGLKDDKVSSLALSDKHQQMERFQKDTLVIKYDSAISTATHRALGTSLVKKLPDLQYDIVKITNGKSLEEVAKTYLKRADVKSVSLSAKVYRHALPDPKRLESYHLDLVNADEAALLVGPNKVRVAVIDTGVDPDHPELKNKVVYNYNVLDPMKKGIPHYHGTHVAGIIGAEKGNGLGGYGINPNVEIIAIDVFGNSYFGTDYAIADGILKAIEQKAQVINMSLGSSMPSPVIEDAVKKAREANITVVASAGNSGNDNPNYPAAFQEVISVGAVDKNKELAYFSTYGPTVDVVAPGVNVYSAVYDQGSSYTYMSGTSMSAPVVTGVVSLLLSKNPNLTPEQVQYILTKTATDLGEEGLDPVYGFGLVNAYEALKFNPFTIPAVNHVKEENLLEEARVVDVSNKFTQKGAIVMLNQSHLYQFDVQEEEAYQILLETESDFDYGFEVFFFKEGETEEAAEKYFINDGSSGVTEAMLFQPKESGTVVIRVKDAAKKYDEKARNIYTLTISNEKLVDDGLSEDNMYEVKQLPFNSAATIGDLYFTQREIEEVEKEEEVEEKRRNGREERDYSVYGDYDYFTFTLPESEEPVDYMNRELVKVTVSGVPGINSTINLYQLERFEMEEGVFHEERYMIDSVNRHSFGAGEELTFAANPGSTYVVVVTNNPMENMWGYYYYYDSEIDVDRSFSSAIPYQLTIESKKLPADEDNLPMGMYDEKYAEEIVEVIPQSIVERNSVFLEEELFPWYNDSEYYQRIKEMALPFELGESQSGYFQYDGDEDWYTFETTETGLYEIEISKQGNTPIVNLLQESEKTGSLLYLASNRSGWYDDPGDEKLVVGLNAGQKYFLRLNDSWYRPSMDEYQFSVTFLMASPEDQYEDNNTFETATDVGIGTLTANFTTAQDVDIYYFKPEESGIFGFHVDPINEYDGDKTGLPSEALQELDPIIVIVEDRNGNKKLDKEEEGQYRIVDSGWYGEEERGSLYGEKGKGYFIAIFDYYGNSSFLSYNFTLKEAIHLVDEDKGSTIKNNVPSKPISLQKDGDGNLFAKGYMNVTSNRGDVDYYELVISEKQQRYRVTLDVPNDLDGVISLFEANGKQLLHKNDYGRGDAEVFYVNLKPGTYYFKVEERHGNASISPYTLKLEKW